MVEENKQSEPRMSGSFANNDERNAAMKQHVAEQEEIIKKRKLEEEKFAEDYQDMRELEVQVGTKVKVAIRLAKVEISKARDELIDITNLQHDHSGWIQQVKAEQGEESNDMKMAKEKSIELDYREKSVRKLVRIKTDEVKRLREFKKVKILHTMTRIESKDDKNAPKNQGTSASAVNVSKAMDAINLQAKRDVRRRVSPKSRIKNERENAGVHPRNSLGSPRHGQAGVSPRRGSAAGVSPRGGAAGVSPRGGAAGVSPRRGAAGVSPRRGSAAGVSPRGGAAGVSPRRGAAGVSPRGGVAGVFSCDAEGQSIRRVGTSVSPRQNHNSAHHGSSAVESDESDTEAASRPQKKLNAAEAREMVNRLTTRESHKKNCHCAFCANGGAVSHVKSDTFREVKRSYSRSCSGSNSSRRSSRR